MQDVSEPAPKRTRRDLLWISSKPFKTKPGVRRDQFPPELTHYAVLNVTSVQADGHPDRVAFSPMYPVPGGYFAPYCNQTFLNFEAFWQYGKVLQRRDTHQPVPAATTRAFWRTVKTPKRSYPGFKKHFTVLHCSWKDGEQLSYLESRKVYIREYRDYVQKHAPERLAYWRDQFQRGRSVVVEDIDGPHRYELRPDAEVPGRLAQVGVPIIHSFDEAFFRDKFYDQQRPFGHGYVVCAMIVDLALDALVDSL